MLRFLNDNLDRLLATCFLFCTWPFALVCWLSDSTGVHHIEPDWDSPREITNFEHEYPALLTLCELLGAAATVGWWCILAWGATRF